MRTPPGIAEFDSATAMVLALTSFLRGKDFPGLGLLALAEATLAFLREPLPTAAIESRRGAA